MGNVVVGASEREGLVSKPYLRAPAPTQEIEARISLSISMRVSGSVSQFLRIIAGNGFEDAEDSLSLNLLRILA